MANQNPVELEVLIVAQNANLRELWELRRDLYSSLENGLPPKDIRLEQAPDSRALDPAVIGAIGIVLLPAFADKLGDLLVNWVNNHNNCSITISVPVEGRDPVVISYHPSVPQDTVKTAIASAIKFSREADL